MACRMPVGEGVAARDLEGYAGRVDGVVLAVNEGRLQVDDGVARENAVFDGLSAPLLYGRDVLPGHGATDDLLFELEARAAVHRLNLQPDVPELAVSSGLLLVPVLDLGRHRDRLAVGDPGGFELYLHAELALHLIDGDVDVHVAKSAQ